MSLSFASMATVPSQPPVWGYDKQDMGAGNVVSLQGPAIQANISAAGGVQDLASAGVQIDTSVPLRGFLIGLGILIAIRVIWEVMDE